MITQDNNNNHVLKADNNVLLGIRMISDAD